MTPSDRPARDGTVRSARPADRPALEDVCLRTADAGGDATALHRDPRLPAQVWLGPYLALEPGLAFVVTDGADRPGGYVVGARDTADFERRCEAQWWPALRRRYPEARWPLGDADGALVHLVHHPRRADPDVVAAYPSHLHVDLLPDWQGAGWGRRLLEALFGALATAGSPGVHLRVAGRNERAIGFYRRMGLTVLDGALPGDARTLTMGRRLDDWTVGAPDAVTSRATSPVPGPGASPGR